MPGAGSTVAVRRGRHPSAVRLSRPLRGNRGADRPSVLAPAFPYTCSCPTRGWCGRRGDIPMIAAEVVDFRRRRLCVERRCSQRSLGITGRRAALFGGATVGSAVVRSRRFVHRGATASCGFGHRVPRSFGIRVSRSVLPRRQLPLRRWRSRARPHRRPPARQRLRSQTDSEPGVLAGTSRPPALRSRQLAGASEQRIVLLASAEMSSLFGCLRAPIEPPRRCRSQHDTPRPSGRAFGGSPSWCDRARWAALARPRPVRRIRGDP